MYTRIEKGIKKKRSSERLFLDIGPPSSYYFNLQGASPPFWEKPCWFKRFFSNERKCKHARISLTLLLLVATVVWPTLQNFTFLKMFSQAQLNFIFPIFRFFCLKWKYCNRAVFSISSYFPEIPFSFQEPLRVQVLLFLT